MALAVVLAVVAIAATVVAVLDRDDGTGRADEPTSASDSSGSASTGAASTDPSSSASTSSSTTTAPLTGAEARAELARIADVDGPVVDRGLVDRWQPQLSSKQVGVTDSDDVFYEDEGQILDHYRGLKARYPTALLVRSSDYGSLGTSGHWVVLLGQAFPTPEEANAWCDAEGWGPGDCYAKRINDEGVRGNTVYR